MYDPIAKQCVFNIGTACPPRQTFNPLKQNCAICNYNNGYSFDTRSGKCTNPSTRQSVAAVFMNASCMNGFNPKTGVCYNSDTSTCRPFPVCLMVQGSAYTPQTVQVVPVQQVAVQQVKAQ